MFNHINSPVFCEYPCHPCHFYFCYFIFCTFLGANMFVACVEGCWVCIHSTCQLHNNHNLPPSPLTNPPPPSPEQKEFSVWLRVLTERVTAGEDRACCSGELICSFSVCIASASLVRPCLQPPGHRKSPAAPSHVWLYLTVITDKQGRRGTEMIVQQYNLPSFQSIFTLRFLWSLSPEHSLCLISYKLFWSCDISWGCCTVNLRCNL